MKKNCLKCNILIIKKSSESRKYWATKKFCSWNCANKENGKIQKGKPIKYKMTEDIKKKIAKGVKKSGVWKNLLNPENREKARINSAITKRAQAIRTPLDELERIRFKNNMRKIVLKRDNYTCLDCGSKKDLHVDHILSWANYPKLRFDINNCRTLCKNCHYFKTWGKLIPDINMQWGGNYMQGDQV